MGGTVFGCLGLIFYCI